MHLKNSHIATGSFSIGKQDTSQTLSLFTLTWNNGFAPSLSRFPPCSCPWTTFANLDSSTFCPLFILWVRQSMVVFKKKKLSKMIDISLRQNSIRSAPFEMTGLYWHTWRQPDLDFLFPCDTCLSVCQWSPVISTVLILCCFAVTSVLYWSSWNILKKTCCSTQAEKGRGNKPHEGKQQFTQLPITRQNWKESSILAQSSFQKSQLRDNSRMEQKWNFFKKVNISH